MTDRFVDAQPELPAITAPRLQFAQGFPNGAFQLDVERRVAAERGGDAVLHEIRESHATVQWAEYKFGVLRRMLNKKETRSRAYVTEVRFGSFADFVTSKSVDEKAEESKTTDRNSDNSVDTSDSETTKGIGVKGVITRQEFRQAYHSLCSYADRMTVYAGQLGAVIARDPSSMLVWPLAKDAAEQVKHRAEAACKAVAVVEKFADEISYAEKVHQLPPRWERWLGSIEDFWVGRTTPPHPYAEDKAEYQWNDYVPRLLHWVQHRGLPLHPDDLIHATAYVEFVDRKLGHFPLPSNRTTYEWVTTGPGHYRYRTMVERWAPLPAVARRLEIDNVEKEWGRNLLDISYAGGTLTLSEIVCATDKLRLAVNYDLPKMLGVLGKYAATHPGEFDGVVLTAKLLRHIRKVRGLYRALIFAGRYLGAITALTSQETAPPWMPWKGNLFDDRHADPRDQADIMDGDRLSEYVFHLIAHVNSKGLPEFADAELRDIVPRANAWDSAQAHARGCRVCRSKAADATATAAAGTGPGDTSLVSGPVSTHPFSTGDVGVIYPECSHSSSERGGGGGWSGGDGGGSGGGFDGGGGGSSGGGGGDCGGSLSW